MKSAACRVMLVLASLPLLAGHPLDAGSIDGDEFDQFVGDAEAKTQSFDAELAGMDAAEISRQLTEKLSGQTRILLQSAHGLYVEYTDENGDLYMWYPYKKKAVLGSWAVLDTYDPPRACFKYKKPRPDKAIKYKDKDCPLTVQILGGIYERASRPGDPFDLRSGKVPFKKHNGDLVHWPDEFESQLRFAK